MTIADKTFYSYILKENVDMNWFSTFSGKRCTQTQTTALKGVVGSHTTVERIFNYNQCESQEWCIQTCLSLMVYYEIRIRTTSISLKFRVYQITSSANRFLFDYRSVVEGKCQNAKWFSQIIIG